MEPSLGDKWATDWSEQRELFLGENMNKIPEAAKQLGVIVGIKWVSEDEPRYYTTLKCGDGIMFQSSDHALTMSNALTHSDAMYWIGVWEADHPFGNLQFYPEKHKQLWPEKPKPTIRLIGGGTDFLPYTIQTLKHSPQHLLNLTRADAEYLRDALIEELGE